MMPFISIKKISKHSKQISLFFLILLFLLILPGENVYFTSPQKISGFYIPEKEILPSPPPIPQKKIDSAPPELTAEGILVKDIKSGVLIYSKNKDERLAPASTSKIMTAMVSLNHYNLDDVLTVNTVITEGKTMGLVRGEKMTAESLLYGALVHSANDAAYALAENYPGGVSKFVDEMNKIAKELGLSNTSFVNPIGFDDEMQFTTAEELGKQALMAMQNPEFAKIVGTRSITVSDISYTYFHDLKNVNELLGKIPGMSGVKTGFTEEGGEILVSEMKKNDHRILIVLLKSKDRFGETQRLIDWVFNTFEWSDPFHLMESSSSSLETAGT